MGSGGLGAADGFSSWECVVGVDDSGAVWD